ncbi:hypothetical protein BT69DRAFT_1279435 [Atractiella rhizophila]|nr:hypothetical protein BT69DRAFT_1279435 [Atractiella rhizophila]
MFHCVPYQPGAPQEEVFELAIVLSPSFMQASGYTKIRLFFRRFSKLPNRPNGKHEAGGNIEIIPLPYEGTDELIACFDEIFHLHFRVSFPGRASTCMLSAESGWEEREVFMSLDQTIYPFQDARDVVRVTYGHGWYRAPVIPVLFQFCRVPSRDTVDGLPNEIWNEIFHELWARHRYNNRRSSTRLRPIALGHVSVRMRALGAQFASEPEKNSEKLAILKTNTAPSSFWQTLRCTKQDFNSLLHIHWSLLFRFGHNISKERQKFLTRLIGLPSLSSISFTAPWTSSEIFWFLTHFDEPTCYAFDLAISSPVLVPECVDSQELEGKSTRFVFYWRKLWFSNISLRSLPSLTSLIVARLPGNLVDLRIHKCFPLPANLEEKLFHSDADVIPLNILHLDLLPSVSYSVPERALYSLSRPLSIPRYLWLYDLSLEGYADNSLLLPYDFFHQMVENRNPHRRGLRRISIKYCSIAFRGFREYCSSFFHRGERLDLVLFFGEWDEEEVVRTWGSTFPVIMPRLQIKEGGADDAVGL